MIKDDVIFASDERRNVVGSVFHVFSWFLFGGKMLPHASEVADLVAANGFLVDSKSRSDSCGFLHPEKQLMAHELSFPRAVLYADWGWVARYKSRRKKKNGQRRRLSGLKNLRNTRQVVKYLSEHATQLYIIDGSILAQMCRRAKRGGVKTVGKKKLKPHITTAHYGDKSLTVSRTLLQAICGNPGVLKIYGLNPTDFAVHKEQLDFRWVMPFTDAHGEVLYEDGLSLQLDVHYIVRSSWLEEIRGMIREQQQLQLEIFERHEKNLPEVPF